MEALAIVLFRLVDAACRIFVYAEITAHHTSYAGYAFVADILLHWFAWTGTEGFREKFAAHNVLNGLASAVYSSVAFAGCDLTRPTWSTPFRTGPWAPSEHMLLGIRCLETVVFGVVLVFAPLQGSPYEVFADRYGWLALALGLGLLVLSILLSMFYVWRCGLIPSQVWHATCDFVPAECGACVRDSAVLCLAVPWCVCSPTTVEEEGGGGLPWLPSAMATCLWGSHRTSVADALQLCTLLCGLVLCSFSALADWCGVVL